MKSTYKLFGIFWDHYESVDFNDLVVVQGNKGINYRQSYCLFDIIGEYRTINISELMCVESSIEFESIRNRLRKYPQIAINIDYIISHNSLISSKFYKRRICQIYCALQQSLTDSCVVIQVPYDKLSDWSALQDLAS